MDLEARVKAYAEEARRILIQRLLDSRGQKGLKAFWQGYSTNGNGIVKLEDGNFKVVKVIGNIVVPKNSIVYIDEQNTVEVGFRKELPAARSQKKEQIKPTVADRVKRPLLLLEDALAIGDFLLSYGYEVADYFDVDRFYLKTTYIIQSASTGTDSISAQIVNSNRYSSKNTYYFGGYNYFFAVISIFGQIPVSGSMSLSGTPFDFSDSATSTSGWQYRHGAMTSYGILTGNGFDATVEWELNSDLPSGGTVSGDYHARWEYFTPPETSYYIQGGEIKSEDPTANEYIRIDLQNYFSDTITNYEIYHHWTKKTQTSADTYTRETFLIFFIETVDFSYSEVITTSTDTDYQYYPYETQFVGKLKRWYLHLKVNLDDGSIVSKTTLQEYTKRGLAYDSETDSQEWYEQRHGWDVFAAIYSYHSSRVGGRTTTQVYVHGPGTTVYHRLKPSYQDVLSEAFEGDWLYEWRDVQIGYDTGGTTWPVSFEQTFELFLRLNFLEGTWYKGLNSRLLTTSPTVEYWEPGTTYADSYQIGEPPDTTINSIIDLYNIFYDSGSTIPTTVVSFADYFDGSVEGVPDVWDEFVDTYWVRSSYLGPQNYPTPPFEPLINTALARLPFFTYVQTPSGQSEQP